MLNPVSPNARSQGKPTPLPITGGESPKPNRTKGTSAPAVSAATQASLITEARLQKWEKLINEYGNVSMRIIGEELYRKLDRINFEDSKEKLAEWEKLRIEKFEGDPAVKAVYEEAKKLFLDAYFRSSGRLDENKLQILNNFLSMTESAIIDEDAVVLFRRLINPDLLPDDRKLAVEYLFPRQGEPESLFIDQNGFYDQGTISSYIRRYRLIPAEINYKNIIDRIASSANNQFASYDGIIDTTRTTERRSADALSWVIDRSLTSTERSGLPSIDSSISTSIIKTGNTWNWLKSTDAYAYRLVRNLFIASSMAQHKSARNDRAFEKAKKELLDYINYLEVATASAPVGSDSKIVQWQLSRILRDYGLANGISYEELSMASYRFWMESPEKVDMNDYLKWDGIFSTVAESPERSDNIKYRSIFIRKIEEIVNKYLSTQDPERRESLLTILSGYHSYISDFNVSLDEYKELLLPMVPARRPGGSKPLTMDELTAGKARIIRPEDLPENIKENLRNTGNWESVSQALFIALTRKIRSGEGFEQEIGGVLGQVTGGLFITLDTYNEETRSAYDPALLTGVLAHEAAHVSWFRENYKNKDLMRSTPDERNAFLTEMNTLTILMKELIERDPTPTKQMQDIAREIHTVRQAVVGANNVIGYPESDFSFRRDIPNDERDMSVYPTNANPPISQEEATSYVEAFMPSLGKTVIRMICTIPNPIKIGFRHNGEAKVDAFKVSDMVMYMQAQNGQRIPIPQETTQKILTFLVEVYKRSGAIRPNDKDPFARVLAILSLQSQSSKKDIALREEMGGKAVQLLREDMKKQKKVAKTAKKARQTVPQLTPSENVFDKLIRIARANSNGSTDEEYYLTRALFDLRGVMEFELFGSYDSIFRTLKANIDSEELLNAYISDVRRGLKTASNNRPK